MDAYERAANESAVFALMRAGNYRGAEARLRTMLGHNANDARALALLADCHLNRKDWKEGLKIARHAANVEPDDPLVRSTIFTLGFCTKAVVRPSARPLARKRRR